MGITSPIQRITDYPYPDFDTLEKAQEWARRLYETLSSESSRRIEDFQLIADEASDHGGLDGLADDDHTQYVLHSLADAANDFLVASADDTIVKKTLAETGAILEADINHDNLVDYAADEHYPVKDEDDMTSDSATHVATQQSIKKYVDDNAGAGQKTVVDGDTGYTVTTSDWGKTIRVDSASDQTVTLPSVGASDNGGWITVMRIGAGKVTIATSDSDTIADSAAGGTIYCDFPLGGEQTITLEVISDDEWQITGGSGIWITT